MTYFYDPERRKLIVVEDGSMRELDELGGGIQSSEPEKRIGRNSRTGNEQQAKKSAKLMKGIEEFTPASRSEKTSS